MCLLGIDIGTSGCKATVIGRDGQVLSQAYQEYGLISNQPGWQEIDPELVWISVKSVMAQSLANGLGQLIKAIGVSSFGEATVAIDHQGQSLGNSMIYIDSRGHEEAKFLRALLGDDKVLSITGTNIQPMYSICKIMWLKRNRPDIYDRTWKFLLFADFILFKLGAKPATDYSLATRTMAFDLVRKEWSSEILEAAGIDIDKFGEPVQSGTPVGQISQQLIKEFDLTQAVMLVSGGHDQPCAALGAGVIKPGLAVDGLGTTECITPAFPEPILTQAMASNHFASVPHVLQGLYVTYAFTFTSGSILKWYRDNWGSHYKLEAERLGINVYDLMIDQALTDPSSVFVLPHFAGAATPYMDMDAQGAIIGLNINTKPEDILKGILEGITFEIMINVERLENAGVIIDELIAVGGLAKSPTFMQLKANIMGKKVTTLNVPEAGTLGVAILAGTACGMFGSIDEAVAQLVKKQTTYSPDPDLHNLYKKAFATYKKIYPAMQSLREN